jgi:hypothetical protein
METINSTNSNYKEDANSDIFNEFKLSTWIFWVIAHTIAFPFATVLLFGLGDLLSFTKDLFPEIIVSGLMYVVWGAVYGGIIGLVQWLFLRKKTAITNAGWIFYSVIGISAAEIIGVILLLIFNIDRNIEIGIDSYGWIVWTVIHFVGGFIAGYFQSFYLKKITPYHRIWILGSFLSWGLGTLIWTEIMSILDSNIFIIILGGILLVIISAIFLNHILKKTIQNKIKTPHNNLYN